MIQLTVLKDAAWSTNYPSGLPYNFRYTFSHKILLGKEKTLNFSFKILMFPFYSYKYLFKEINRLKKNSHDHPTLLTPRPSLSLNIFVKSFSMQHEPVYSQKTCAQFEKQTSKNIGLKNRTYIQIIFINKNPASSKIICRVISTLSFKWFSSYLLANYLAHSLILS